MIVGFVLSLNTIVYRLPIDIYIYIWFSTFWAFISLLAEKKVSLELNVQEISKKSNVYVCCSCAVNKDSTCRLR